MLLENSKCAGTNIWRVCSQILQCSEFMLLSLLRWDNGLGGWNWTLTNSHFKSVSSELKDSDSLRDYLNSATQFSVPDCSRLHYHIGLAAPLILVSELFKPPSHSTSPSSVGRSIQIGVNRCQDIATLIMSSEFDEKSLLTNQVSLTHYKHFTNLG